MYQRLVAVLFIGALGMAAYFVHHSNIEDIFAMADGSAGSAVSSTEDIAGLYLCTTKTGCSVPSRLTLTLSGKAKLDTIGSSTLGDNPESLSSVPVDNSDEQPATALGVPVETKIGAWQVLPGGFLEITYSLSGGQNDAQDTTKTIVVQSVTTTFLTKFIYSKEAYPSLKKPRFVRETLIR